MLNKGLSKLGLELLDRTTDAYPSFGPKLFQRAFVGFFGSRMMCDFYLRTYRKQWNASRSLLNSSQSGRANESAQRQKILLIVDVCIGDSVLAAQCLPAIRRSFPYAELHYVCNKTGGELIDGIPEVHVHNIIQGERGFPTAEDIARLQSLVAKEKFSVVLNLGPFLSKKALGPTTRMIQLYLPLAAYAIRAWKLNGPRHISYLSRAFASEFLGPENSGVFKSHRMTDHLHADQMGSLNTNAVYLSSDAISRAQTFLEELSIASGNGIVFFNPDATSKYGQIPFDIQAKLLREIADLKQVSAILIGRAYTSIDIERSLIATLPDYLLKKVHIVPHMPIEAYTALIDASDMFISGDTGPLHIAACRKLGQDGSPLRNKTVILAIYGATDSRMYGYDSEQPFHAPANQDAPSRSFSAPALCRNITCVNKFGKSCAEVRCFDGLPIDEIVDYISSYFKTVTGEWIPLLSDNVPIKIPTTLTLEPEREYAI
jgi:ADP-heptose:LPS heptosyltransferase